jgi:uncharacterized protein (DUF1697 family)
MARTAEQWSVHAAGGPFPDAESGRPNHLMLCLSKRPPNPDAVERLTAHAALGERVSLSNGALWVDFVGGVADSKLLPALLDKLVGSTVTARNWNTVLKLHAMASA